MKNILKSLVVTSVLAVLLMITMTTANAYQGTWQSGDSFDLNGVSTVETTYITGGNDAETVKLLVKMTSVGTVGVKEVGVKVDQRVEHTCWGLPLKYRYGRVEIKSSAHHNPKFNS
ncbi:MAG: hypothetical protein PHS98_00910 [Bacilli bacterium]|nr:hypothetical protein [Bacilli bacterium]